MKYINTLKQDVSLFGAEIKRAYKLFKSLSARYNKQHIFCNYVGCFHDWNAVGDSTQIFGVVFFPNVKPYWWITLALETILKWAFEQVYISKFS